MAARGTRRRKAETGSAIADFALVSVVLLPLFFGILQLALVWQVKTTLTSAASEGARYGAGYGRQVSDGAARTSQVVDEVFGSDFDDRVAASSSFVEGAEVVQVEVRAEVPVLAWWGPTIEVEARGHAIREVLP